MLDLSEVYQLYLASTACGKLFQFAGLRLAAQTGHFCAVPASASLNAQLHRTSSEEEMNSQQEILCLINFTSVVDVSHVNWNQYTAVKGAQG